MLVASLVSIGLQPWLAPTPLAPFIAAVAVSAWLGGVGPALVSLVVALPLIDWFAIPPYGGWSVDPTASPTFVTFLALSAVLIGLRVGRDRAEAARQASEAQFRHLADALPQIVYILSADAQTSSGSG